MADVKYDATGQQIEPVEITHVGGVALPTTNGALTSAPSLPVLAQIYAKSSANDAMPVPVESPSDAKTPTAYPLAVYNFQNLFNGATWDRQRNNHELTVLASAVRTGTATSADQTNHNARGVIVLLDVTAAPGGGETLTLLLQFGVGGKYATAFQDGTPRSAATAYWFGLYPTALATTPFHGQQNLVLPRTWRAMIQHSAGGSWTYSVSAALIL